MPRPGPRPYECVRRAWHSERHQPMRGSLIREIFRVVDETHGPATKKNKEWQEKLPVVVLKSEEIMYSKANSEAEYMDLKTLWERTNDAINTIIRRDESTETGELLPPCIEAALNLGCKVRRTSRSQRNCIPRCYLTSSTQDENGIQGSQTVNSQGITHYSTFMKSTNTDTTQNPVVQHNNGSTTNKFPFASENVPSFESYPSLNSYSVYPLYDGNCFKFEEPLHGFENLSNSTSNNVEPVKINFVQNSSFVSNSSIMAAQTYIMGSPGIPGDIECDLSLRLGPLSVTGPSVEYNQRQPAVKDVGSSSLEGNKLSDLAPQMNKQLYFFSKANVEDPLDNCSSQWSVEADNVDTKLRKRKAVSIHPLEDQHFHWQSKLPYNKLTERMRSAGL
ncbi:hypothetical protein Ddye_006932 [Dipteronia dyeriana]|uniref:Histone acetyltransferase n=1 Tax=Dipteronia dyeriana TaxID=168575 RepID=A0AAE0CR62_9ROSI|nr:hypothetical protein Ddye_006932 [Dipteronia dyeriana]